MHILVLSRSDRLAIHVIRCLWQAGHTAHLWCAENTAGARHSRFCSAWTSADPQLFTPPYNGAVHAVQQQSRQIRCDLVLAVDMPAVHLLAAIQGHLGSLCIFPLATPDCLQMLDNKWALARFLQSHHLPVPRTWRVESEEQLSGLDLPYPVIVKPVQLENRQGVKQIDSLTAAVAHLREPHPAHRLPLLFQEYIPGTDVDLSILANHGEVVDWTIQQWVKPGTLRFIDDEAILGLGRQLAAACRFHGLAHFDLRRDDRDGSVKVLECNPRFWATLRESMWNGTNFVARGIQLATGQLAPAQQVNRQITYSFPSQTLATCLKGDFSGLRGLNTESWQGTWQAFSDPLTWLHKVRSQL